MWMFGNAITDASLVQALFHGSLFRRDPGAQPGHDVALIPDRRTL